MSHSLRLFIIALCSLLSAAGHAQITLEGNIANLPANAQRNLEFEAMDFDSWKMVASLPVDAEGHFIGVFPKLTLGQYRLRVKGQAKVWGDMILQHPTGQVRKVALHLDFNQLNGGPISVDDSEESQAYLLLMNASMELDKAREANKENFQARCLVEDTFNVVCETVKKKYPNTYTARVVCGLMYCPRSKAGAVDEAAEKRYVQTNGLKSVPFREERVEGHYGLIRVLNKYVRAFDFEKDSVENLIDKTMVASLINDSVAPQVFHFLLEKMMDYKSERGLSYLLTWYSFDCADDIGADGQTKILLEALSNCAPGKKAIELKLPDLQGKMISLQEVCAKNKLTLVMFWRSNCTHCEEFEPVLSGLYDKYKPLGVEVYAINADKLEADWKAKSAKRSSKWINTFLAYDQRKRVNRNFPVPSTPMLIALDKNGVIVSRLIMRSKLQQFLDTELAGRK